MAIGSVGAEANGSRRFAHEGGTGGSSHERSAGRGSRMYRAGGLAESQRLQGRVRKEGGHLFARAEAGGLAQEL